MLPIVREGVPCWTENVLYFQIICIDTSECIYYLEFSFRMEIYDIRFTVGYTIEI